MYIRLGLRHAHANTHTHAYIRMQIDRSIFVWDCVTHARAARWPLHDIAITSIAWHVLQQKIVGGKHYSAQ